MIYFLIFLDIIINNYSPYTSFFFLTFLYKKSYKYYLLTALILDFIVFNTYYYNLIILTIMYFLNKIFTFLNLDNFYSYLFFFLFNYNAYIILSNLVALTSMRNLFISLGSNLLINMFFYLLCYNVLTKKHIS